ncbi:maleylpyruvate isomerase N-terminal domain-containing protein, partial [Streptomyces sp. CRN 30]|uniref:maleylpyruvate isomerase N-terminal domain-containing protein n=1 Tax=Streptomyces sp. CRN 30 TaxID=3075613 RepID=UPI002A8057A8
MTPLAHDRFCDEIIRQTRQLSALLADGADLGATVPTCPDWTLEELVRHVGRALLWTEHIVRTRATADLPVDDVPGTGGPARRGDAGALREWLAGCGAGVAGALRE